MDIKRDWKKISKDEYKAGFFTIKRSGFTDFAWDIYVEGVYQDSVFNITYAKDYCKRNWRHFQKTLDDRNARLWQKEKP
jgi:hypothetical protein